MPQKTFPAHAVANIVWRSKREIGRKMPPPGTEQFAATARFAGDDELNLFSVVLLFSPLQPVQEEIQQEVTLHFLAPELVLPRLKVASMLHITDGIKVIANAKIKRIESAD